MVTVAVSVPPCPSVIVYVKLSEQHNSPGGIVHKRGSEGRSSVRWWSDTHNR